MINAKNKHIYESLTAYANKYATKYPQVDLKQLQLLNNFIGFIADDFTKKPKAKTVYDKCIICNKINNCICGK